MMEAEKSGKAKARAIVESLKKTTTDLKIETPTATPLAAKLQEKDVQIKVTSTAEIVKLEILADPVVEFETQMTGHLSDGKEVTFKDFGHRKIRIMQTIKNSKVKSIDFVINGYETGFIEPSIMFFFIFLDRLLACWKTKFKTVHPCF